jgi:hypothetical protein
MLVRWNKALRNQILSYQQVFYYRAFIKKICWLHCHDMDVCEVYLPWFLGQGNNNVWFSKSHVVLKARTRQGLSVQCLTQYCR